MHLRKQIGVFPAFPLFLAVFALYSIQVRADGLDRLPPTN